MCEDRGLRVTPGPRTRTKDIENHLPKKIRVYELAKELGLTNKEGLDLALSLGIGVKSHSSSIEDAQADRVRRKADAEGLRREVDARGAAAATGSGPRQEGSRPDASRRRRRPPSGRPAARPCPPAHQQPAHGVAGRPAGTAAPAAPASAAAPDPIRRTAHPRRRLRLQRAGARRCTAGPAAQRRCAGRRPPQRPAAPAPSPSRRRLRSRPSRRARRPRAEPRRRVGRRAATGSRPAGSRSTSRPGRTSGRRRQPHRPRRRRHRRRPRAAPT